MRTLLLCSFALLVACGSAEDKPVEKPVVVEAADTVKKDATPRTYIENGLLKGNIKSIRTTTYDPVYEGGKMKSTKVSDSPDGNTYVTLNEAGYMIEIVYYDGDGKVRRIEKSVYNELGHPTGNMQYNGDDVHETTTELKYDENGYLVEMSLRDSAGTLGMVGFFENDANGYPWRVTMERANGILIRKAEYVYDANGLMLTGKYYDDKDILNTEEKVTYDENGNRIEMEYHYLHPSKTEIRTYSYEFDEQGNWIKNTTYDAGGNVWQIIEREIEYY